MFAFRLEHKQSRVGPWSSWRYINYKVSPDKLSRGVYPFHPETGDRVHEKPPLLRYGYKTAVESLEHLKEWFEGHFDLLHACDFEIAKYRVNKRKHKAKFGEMGQVLIPIGLVPTETFPINRHFSF